MIANGRLRIAPARASQTVWSYEQPEPTSTYLITLQIGDYEAARLASTPVPMQAALPARLRGDFDHDFARQPEMMKLFVELFGPYPLANGYTVVVTDDPLEIPLEAQGISIFGANHCDGTRASERLIAHELAHQWFGNSVTVAAVARHLAARGIRLLRGMVMVRTQRRFQRRRAGAPVPRSSCGRSRKTCCWPIPDRATCSTTACTSAAP